jgi:YD repeat-containing protein
MIKFHNRANRKIKAILVLAGLAVLTSAFGAVADTTTSYVYDALGRVTEVSYPDGSKVTYTYDAAGNRTQVVKTAGTGVKVVVLPLLGGLVVPIH